MKRLIIIPFILLCFGLNATNYYVKTGGDDTNTGLSDAQAFANHPWMSTWTGTVTLTAGDTVFMNRGNTWTIANPEAAFMTVTQSGSVGSHIVTTSYGTGNKPLINISTETNYPVIYADAKSYITFDNLHITHNSSVYYNNINRSGIFLEGTTNPCHDITIQNCEINDCQHYGIYAQADAYNIIIGDTTATETATAINHSNYVYDFGYAGIMLQGVNPEKDESYFYVYYNYIKNSTRSTSGDNAYGIHFTALTTSSNWPKYAYAKYNRVDDIRTWSALGAHGGSYLYFENNYVYNFGRSGIVVGATNVSGLTSICEFIYIDSNVIEQPVSGWTLGSHNAFISKNSGQVTGNNIQITNNSIFYTARPASANWYGISFQDVDNITVDNNYIYNGSTVTGNSAITIVTTSSYDITNATISNNLISEWGPGLIYEITNGTFTGDIVQNAIILPPSTYGCIRGVGNISGTSVMNLFNNTFYANSASSAQVIYSTGGIAAGGVVNVKNNIFAHNAAKTYYMYWIGANAGTLTWDYNLYHNATYSKPFFIQSAKTFVEWNSAGYDANGLNATDPLLYPNYKLKSTSPAIEAGVDVGLPFTGSAPDIGAYPYRWFLNEGTKTIFFQGKYLQY